MPFEVVVRPVVFPDIRPTPKRTLPPEDNPESGFCEIHGSGLSFVNLPYSFSNSQSSKRPTERKRRYDRMRVYQKEDSGKVNKKNFVDVDVPTKILFNEGAGQSVRGTFWLDKDHAVTSGDKTDIQFWQWYRRAKEAENIKRMKKDQEQKNEGQ